MFLDLLYGEYCIYILYTRLLEFEVHVRYCVTLARIRSLHVCTHVHHLHVLQSRSLESQCRYMYWSPRKACSLSRSKRRSSCCNAATIVHSIAYFKESTCTYMYMYTAIPPLCRDSISYIINNRVHSACIPAYIFSSKISTQRCLLHDGVS